MSAMGEKQQPNFPLDCPSGLSCGDYECELRHLDAEEQDLRREATPGARSGACSSGSNEPPKVIITASRDMGRSASTWVFNAVRLLLLQAGVLCDSYWMRTLTPERIERRIQAANAMQLPGQPSVVLIKTHEYESDSPEFFQNIRPLLSHIIVSVRQGFQPDAFWVEHSTHVVQYEDIVVSNPTYDASLGAMSVLNDLARHLGVSLSHDQLRQTDYRLMTLPIPGDQSTKFWSFHGRQGGRTIPDPPNTLQKQKKHQPIQHNIFVTRHGARQDNGPDRDSQWLAKAGHRRRQDAPLSPNGHNAATELAEALRRYRDDERQQSFIISSPLIRCMETAQAVSQVWKVPIWVEPGIAEVGTRPSHVGSLEELQQLQFAIDTAYEPVMAIGQLPQHEYGDGAAARRAEKVATKVVERIVRDHEQDKSFNVLFVGHGASCLGLVSAFGAPSDYVGYCSLTRFQQSEGEAEKRIWTMEGTLGDVEHLSDQDTALGSAW